MNKIAMACDDRSVLISYENKVSEAACDRYVSIAQLVRKHSRHLSFGIWL